MASASAPPSDDEKSLDLEGSDELEMTSIMDAEQRRELQRAARKEAERQKESEHATARPPAEAAAVLAAEEMAIPKAPAVPSDVAQPKAAPVLGPEAARAPRAAPPSDVSEAEPRAGLDALSLIAFVLLAVAIVYALRS